MSQHTTMKRTARWMAPAAGLALGVAAFASPALAQNEDGVMVGTFEPRQVFQNYEGRQQMMQNMRQMQQKAQQAQQNGDQQAAQQAQQKMQQQRQQMMQEFRSNMEEAAAQVAEEQNATLVVSEVTYASDEVQTQDLTEQVTKALNESVETGQQQGQSLNLPGAGQQQGQEGQDNRRQQQMQQRRQQQQQQQGQQDQPGQGGQNR